MSKIKNAFTFAELMISLVIIGVITLLLYPTISDLTPNHNQYLFKETYQTITMLVSDYINSFGTGVVPTERNKLCQIFCERLNSDNINANNNTCEGTNANPGCTSFTTSNGMRWAFATNNNIGYVLVDVNASNNDISNDSTPNGTFPNTIGNGFNNNPWTGNNEGKGIFYNTGNATTQDTFLFEIQSTGEITPQGNVAIQHLQSGN